jgi:hypothetical protein
MLLSDPSFAATGLAFRPWTVDAPHEPVLQRGLCQDSIPRPSDGPTDLGGHDLGVRFSIDRVEPVESRPLFAEPPAESPSKAVSSAQARIAARKAG